MLFPTWFLLYLIQHINCQERKSFYVYTSQDLQNQLNRISSGETIILHEGIYKGNFKSSQNGSSDSYILMIPYLDAKVTILGTGKNGVAALTLMGDYWSVENLQISNHNGFGLLFKGTGDNANRLIISDVDTGVVLQGKSNTAYGNSISEARMGVLVKGNGCTVMKNNIVGASPSILAEEGTCCGIVRDNVCDGDVDIQGSEYSVQKMKTKFNLVGGTHTIKGDVRVVAPPGQ